MPSNSTFPSPQKLDFGTPTPLVPACPAIDPFPFPEQRRNLSALPPLSLRRRDLRLRPSQRPVSTGALARSRIASKKFDRFVLPRKSPTSSRESLRLSAHPGTLTPMERMTRRRHPASDPFSRRVPRNHNRVHESLQTLRSSHTDSNNTTGQQSNDSPLALRHAARQVSNGAVWNVGGSAIVADSVPGVPNGRGSMLSSGTNAPLYTSMFLTQSDATSEQVAHENRLAFAMNIDPSNRVLGSFGDWSSPPRASVSGRHEKSSPTGPTWIDNEWVKDDTTTILDAPALRDDYYCSLLAYSYTAKCLAVGLAGNVYLWSETQGVGTPESLNIPYAAHVTSVSFSSTQGGQAILAIGRADGGVALWSVFEQEPRFNSSQPSPVSCLSFSPNTAKRPSIRDSSIMVNTEQLLIGDELGHIYFYSVEWPDATTRDLFDWQGAMTILCKLSVHTQQICGIVWSLQSEFFATGGNDNHCCLFETKRVISLLPQQYPITTHQNPDGSYGYTVTPGQGPIPSLDVTNAKHRFTLNAAVKAIAFCPWQRGLLAIGGGSNDRCIHFYHTISGACLATIDCSAQVTSLIWSTTRREICATFGFAQPEHAFRIAVFSWPACEQLVAIPWPDEHRALYAVPYPGGPNNGRTKGEGGAWWSRTQVEGCVVVATSDASIKFHEVWSEERRRGCGLGGLGGSDILEELHGCEKEGQLVIR
ncbi:uncharacterized protein K452DRAFT_229057 [Aplosporella prunicola CBS 121167]|uniref:Anaphase-promoting complex subunit 4 WD40 domain-containing protein n=1 Tax=Aplosporella prunicola CBS 121167 TaxID=1176127 RepID=A0A6A6BBE0_9PEZI|nr:uncharacterized protein K452DRAFT_229057 [Aplosporella prunicola CBS 121167]KAF2141366.1 hypothetical protein K452DRAFT_229057 [Aplosporella prunicola CBS 121167]